MGLGEDASGLSASSIPRLTEQWQAEHEAFRRRSLRFHRYCYLFVDGVHMSVRLGENDQLCLLVVIGVRQDGEKELLAVEDGYRESTDSWAAAFRDPRDRGLGSPMRSAASPDATQPAETGFGVTVQSLVSITRIACVAGESRGRGALGGGGGL